MKFSFKRKVKIAEKPDSADSKRIAREEQYQQRLNKTQKRRSYGSR